MVARVARQDHRGRERPTKDPRAPVLVRRGNPGRRRGRRRAQGRRNEGRGVTDTAQPAPRCVNCDGIWRAPQHVNKTCDYTIGVLSDEYDALKAVEAAARELATAVYTVLENGWDVATATEVQRVAIARLAVDNSTAALDAIRHPDNGKTGEARL